VGRAGLYRLPYFHALMRVETDGEFISYGSERGQARWKGRYKAVSGVRLTERGSSNHFLTERHCLYTVSNGQAYRGEIHHLPWPLREAVLETEENTVAEAAGIRLMGEPQVLSFASELRVLIWALERVRQPGATPRPTLRKLGWGTRVRIVYVAPEVVVCGVAQSGTYATE
jgi:uncharacterized protein